MKSFAFSILCVLAFASIGFAQCSNGSCGVSSARRTTVVYAAPASVMVPSVQYQQVQGTMVAASSHRMTLREARHQRIADRVSARHTSTVVAFVPAPVQQQKK